MVLVFSFLGSRLFYVLYQEPSFYWNNPEQVFFVWNGGFVFFGGLMGGLLGLSIHTKRKKESFEKWLNFGAPLLSLGYAFGRFACLLGGCCYGKTTELPWAVFMHGAYRHPSQLYASLMEFLIFFVLMAVEKRIGFKKYVVLPLWMVLHGAARIVMEAYRDDPRGETILGLSISTCISLILVVFGVAILFQKYRYSSRQISES